MSSPLTAANRLYLVDGTAYIFRAYHALPPLTRKSDGMPIGAVSGFCNMLWKLLADVMDEAAPENSRATHLAVVLDHSGTTFRNALYDLYKANRAEPPEDLIPQFALIREAVHAFGLPCIEKPGFEADDLIATYATQAEAAGASTTIISSDKDLMQLVTEKTTMLDTMHMRHITIDAVIEKFGVLPEKVIDVQALAGDSADNVPGVPGIGVKTAAQLITEFGDLDTLLAQAACIKQTKRRENLIAFADDARMSRELVTLKQDVPDLPPVTDFFLQTVDYTALTAFLENMELATLARRVRSAAPDGGGEDSRAVSTQIDRTGYETVFDVTTLEKWITRAYQRGYLAIDTETTGLNAMAVDLVGISLATAPGTACYIPIGHAADTLDLDDHEAARQLPLGTVIAVLKPILEDPSILKIGQNMKYDTLVLSRYGIMTAPIDDTMLMSYALDCGRHGHGMDDLSDLFLNYKPISFSALTGKGKAKKTFDQIAISEASPYAAEDADVTLRLHDLFSKRLVHEAQKTTYENLDRPLVPIIRDMERHGIKIDPQLLAGLSHDFAQRMRLYEETAHKAAGETFNLASAKQVAHILFEKLGLPGGKKTAGGAWSTKADVLEALAASGHALPQTLLAWRALAKLKNTYTDALPHSINKETGRVHTAYALAATTTGRLSSNDPNLQNIPIRTEDGRKIRTAFVAEEGNVLISADYSQIELRLLAHIADLQTMKNAFAKGIDIHAMTASEMFDIPVEEMDSATRRQAKAINFGIIYGISAFGLANQLGISRAAAKAYIDSYFEKFPGIREYMDTTIARAKTQGYVETVFGRRLYVKNIQAKIPAQRAAAERQAINAPIQGAAADIIRRAMIRMPDALRQESLAAKMLLQVHDELIFECPADEAQDTCAIVKKIMQNAAEPAQKISVPLLVETGIGNNWGAAH